MAEKEVNVQHERTTLETQKREIEDELARLREWLKSEVDVDADEGDPELFEREKNQALVITMERQLESVEDALRALDKGTYGICERCRKPIDPARLEVRPEARLCLSCQQEVERLMRRGTVPPPSVW